MSNMETLLNGGEMTDVSPPLTDAWTRKKFEPVLSVMYSREPSVRRFAFAAPSWVTWTVLSTRGGGIGRLSQATIRPRAMTTTAVGTRILQSFLPPAVRSSVTFRAPDDGGPKAGINPAAATPCCAPDCDDASWATACV